MMVQDRLFAATAMPDADWWHVLWPDPDGVVAALRIAAGMTVVDVGCGDGWFTAAIARRVEPGRVIGVDLDAALLARAQTACAQMTTAEWVCGDAMSLRRLIPYPVDFVLLANTFHGVPDKAALAAEVAAVLQPAGRFAIVNWHAKIRDLTSVLGQPRGPRTELRMTPEQTRMAVQPAGFTLETLVALAPYHYAALFTKVGAEARETP